MLHKTHLISEVIHIILLTLCVRAIISTELRMRSVILKIMVQQTSKENDKYQQISPTFWLSTCLQFGQCLLNLAAVLHEQTFGQKDIWSFKFKFYLRQPWWKACPQTVWQAGRVLMDSRQMPHNSSIWVVSIGRTICTVSCNQYGVTITILLHWHQQCWTDIN